jgi:hypothetical protein
MGDASFLSTFWFVTEKKKVLVEEFWSALGVPKHFMFWYNTPKSGVPKLYSTPFFCNAVGAVYITKFYHYLANHYITETITKLPATAELPLPPLRCRCCRRAATVLPKALLLSVLSSVVCVIVRCLLCCPSSALLSVVCVIVHCLH